MNTTQTEIIRKTVNAPENLDTSIDTLVSRLSHMPEFAGVEAVDIKDAMFEAIVEG